MSDFSSGGAGNSISKLCLNLPSKEYSISIISLGKCAYSKILKKKKNWCLRTSKEKAFFFNKWFKQIIKK